MKNLTDYRQAATLVSLIVVGHLGLIWAVGVENGAIASILTILLASAVIGRAMSKTPAGGASQIKVEYNIQMDAAGRYQARKMLVLDEWSLGTYMSEKSAKRAVEKDEREQKRVNKST